MARRSRRINLWIWIFITAFSGGSLTGILPFDLGVIWDRTYQTSDNTTSTERSDVRSGAANEQISVGNPRSLTPNLTNRDASFDERPLRIASFNIQVLGQSKMSKPEVVNALAVILRRFDLVAIQEVRSKESDVLPRLTQAVNAGQRNYSFLIGPRLGRTVSKEQYAFIFDTDRIEYDPGSIGTISDPDDLLHRPPFVARFRAKTREPNRAFSFWMVNTHTDPDEVPQEINALADVFRVMQQNQIDEDDVILLGDLNAAPNQFGALRSIPFMKWLVDNVPTNTRRNKTYDNLLFSGRHTTEFTGVWGVFDMEKELGLSFSEALQVSDHLPVWSEFSQWETAGSVQ